MDLLYYISVPVIIIGSVLYVKNNNITKEECIHFSLQSINKLNDVYKYLESQVVDIVSNCTKKNYKNFEIVKKEEYKNNITKIDYNYNDKLFIIVYDTLYPKTKDYNVNNILDRTKIVISQETNKIAFIEFLNTITNKTLIIDTILKDYIIRISGPNQDFYKRNKQPIYIPATILDETFSNIVNNVEEYIIQITYMDLKQIQNNIITI